MYAHCGRSVAAGAVALALFLCIPGEALAAAGDTLNLGPYHKVIRAAAGKRTILPHLTADTLAGNLKATQLHSQPGTEDTSARIRPDTVAGNTVFVGKPTFNIGFSTGGSPTRNTDLAMWDAILDTSGMGDFTNLNDAVAKGAKRIWARKGTYKDVTVGNKLDRDDLYLAGTWSSIFSGGATKNGLTISGARVTVTGVQAVTTAGGPSTATPFWVSGADCNLLFCYSPSADYVSLYTDTGSDRLRAIGNYFVGADAYGVYGAGGDDVVMVANHIKDAGSGSLYDAPGSNNWIVVGQRSDGNVNLSGTGSNPSGSQKDSVNVGVAY